MADAIRCIKYSGHDFSSIIAIVSGPAEKDVDVLLSEYEQWCGVAPMSLFDLPSYRAFHEKDMATEIEQHRDKLKHVRELLKQYRWLYDYMYERDDLISVDEYLWGFANWLVYFHGFVIVPYTSHGYECKELHFME